MTKQTIALTTLLSLTSCETAKNINWSEIGSALLQNDELNESTIASGLSEALKVGTDKAVKTLSKDGSFSQSASKLIVPDELTKAAEKLRKYHLGFIVDSFESKMNEAAEKAVVSATPIFLDTISKMTFDDARQILQGDDTAITDFFNKRSRSQLKKSFLPIINNKMTELGTVKKYNELMAKYDAIPFTPEIKFDLGNYVTDKALDGLFTQLAEVEKDIRANPAARTTELLKKVFAKQ